MAFPNDQHDQHDETALEDKLLAGLIDHLEDLIHGDLQGRKGVAVEVAAPDKEHLKEGLEKAQDVVDGSPEVPLDVKSGAVPESADESDEDRIMQSLDEEDRDDEDDRK